MKYILRKLQFDRFLLTKHIMMKSNRRKDYITSIKFDISEFNKINDYFCQILCQIILAYWEGEIIKYDHFYLYSLVNQYMFA